MHLELSVLCVCVCVGGGYYMYSCLNSRLQKMQSLDLKDDKKETSSSSHKANEWGWVWPTLARIVDTTQWYLRCKGPNTRTYRDVGFSKLI